MSQIGLERIQLLFQTWPESFKLRYKRPLTKEEIIRAVDNRAKELEANEIRTKFDTFQSDDLRLVKKFLDETEIDHILTEVSKPKYKVIEEDIHEAKLKSDLLESLTGMSNSYKPNIEAEESKPLHNNKSKKNSKVR